jgi:hypothetical protein
MRRRLFRILDVELSAATAAVQPYTPRRITQRGRAQLHKERAKIRSRSPKSVLICSGDERVYRQHLRQREMKLATEICLCNARRLDLIFAI